MKDRREYFRQRNATPERKEWRRLWNLANPDKVQAARIRGHLKNHPRRIQFKYKRIQIDEDPRIGICQLCGAVKGINCKVTHIHHMQYHDEDPLKDTIEVCVGCHRRQHRK